MPVDGAERRRAGAGALIGLLVTGLLAGILLPPGDVTPWLVAPIGASAVLVFCAPASPFAHPWAVVAGNTLSALAGIACVHALGAGPVAAAAAASLAIMVMFTLRCLHPPGGACAVLTALGGVTDPHFALVPVLLDSVLLVATGMAYNNATRRAYPQRAALPATEPAQRRSFTDADLDAVLARHNQVLDVSREDLHTLLEEAQVQAWRRRARQLRCSDVMSRETVAVSFGTPVHEAWRLLRQHRVKALPVLDRARRIVGIVTLADFMREAGVDPHPRWAQRLRQWLRPSPGCHSEKPEAVGQIMTRQVRVVSAGRPIGDLLPLFASTGHHHVPVIDAERRLAGIITQSDVVRALARLD
ncbi:MAG: HPP family protein [Burkholderiales bacterium]|nr:HPP family protein [Burkholderiales bacterium]